MRAVALVMVIAVGVLVLAGLIYIATAASRECEAKGGTLVRAYGGYACVKELP